MNAAPVRMNSLEEALAALAARGLILVTDDADRENEGDLICAAEAASPEAVNFMARWGRGLICAALSPERARQLRLAPAASSLDVEALHGTAFTESVDYRHGTTTGISAADRSATLRALADPQAQAGDFARPGHVFPLIARPGGVLERRGHTEATVDLCRLAGFSGTGVLCEVLDEDGSMARGERLRTLADGWGLPLISVEQLARWLAQKPEK